jgi:hypothetical protein
MFMDPSALPGESIAMGIWISEREGEKIDGGDVTLDDAMVVVLGLGFRLLF